MKEKAPFVKLIFLITPLVFLTLSCWGVALPGTGHHELAYKGGLVSVKGEQVPTLGILEELAQTVGVEVLIFGAPPFEAVSIDLKDQQPEIVLRTILKGASYAVVRNTAGGSRGVRIIQTSSSPSENGKSRSTAVGVADRTETADPKHPGTSPKPERARANRSSSGADSQANPSTIHLFPDVQSSATGNRANSPGISAREEQSSISGKGGNSSSASAESGNQGAQEAPNTATPSTASRTGPSPVERLQKIIAGYEQRIASGESDRQYQTAVDLVGEGHAVHDRDRMAFFQEALKEHLAQ